MFLPLFTIYFSVAVSGLRKSSASRNSPQNTVKIRAFSLSNYLADRYTCSGWFEYFLFLICWNVHGIDRLMEITDDIFDVSIGWIVDSIDWFYLLHNVSIFSYSLWTFVWKLSPPPPSSFLLNLIGGLFYSLIVWLNWHFICWRRCMLTTG